MQTRLGALNAELSEAERAKFTAPMVLVHGLWDQAQSWRRFTGFLSHRGWRCIALGWPDDTDRRSLADCDGALARALDSLGEPAVLVGHDLGGLMALRAAARARAVVALAPLIPDAANRLREAGTWLQRRRGAPLSAGRKLRDAYPGAAGSEPATLVDGFAGEANTGAVANHAPPRLVLAGTADSIVTPEAARRFAAERGADIEVVTGGHALHYEDGWEERAGVIHRWLIRNLGEELLALYEEAWADRAE